MMFVVLSPLTEGENSGSFEAHSGELFLGGLC